MTFLLDRDRAAARSRYEVTKTALESAEASYEKLAAEADAAFDRWEARPNDEQAKADATQKGDRRMAATRTHIGAVTAHQEAQRVLTMLEDPQELERRMRVAETHEDWWKSRR